MGGFRRFGAWTATLALLTATVVGQSGATAAQAASHGLAIQPAGDGGWSPSARPGDSTFAWSPPKGKPAGHAPVVDPHAKVVRELPASRTQNADFYQLSDGRVREKLSAGVVNYRDAHGAWQPIDTTVRTVSAHQGYTVGNLSNQFASYFSANASSLVRLEQGGAYVQMGADGAHASAPRVSGPTVAYPGAYPGVDLRYQITAQGLKEQIVLAKPPAASQARAGFSFTLKVGGLVPKQRRDGSIGFYGAESGALAFLIPAPYMADSHADVSSPYGTAYSTHVTQSMTWDAKSGTARVTVRPDASWLASSARVYPVVIDPTILVSSTSSASSNVMILQDTPSTNYDTSWRLSVGTTTTGAARSLIKFQLPSIPTGTTITSAALNLYYDQTFTTDANNVKLEAEQANATWDPTTATWSNASSIGGTVLGSVTKAAGVVGVWNSYTVTSAVQAWLNGTSPNNGFVVRAVSESTLGQGGPRYEASTYAYQGEVANYPQLVITYGVPGVTLNAPSVIHATGAELSWSSYTNSTGNSGNNIVEYQVHRSVYQTFTPSASTEVAPVPAGTTSFVDSTATPTPANSSDPYGNAYYYMVVVKTANGALIPAPTQLVRLPKAGRTEILLPSVAATTLSSAQPTTVLNTLTDSGLQQPWLEVGDNSSTYGTARAVFDFGALSQVPAGSTILDAHLKLWQMTTTTGTSGAVYEVHPLTRSFTGSQATWNKATSTTAWSSPGGDFGAVGGTISGLTNDPNRRNFDATAIVQGWVNTPASDHGLEVKLAAESSSAPQERTIFAGPHTAEPKLAPALVVTYLDQSTNSTYYAPSTPTKMHVGTTYTVPVTVNNTTATTWSAANVVLTYHWLLPDGTDVTTTGSGGNQLQTALPADMAPGATATLNAAVTPPTPADSNELDGYSIAWDMYNKATGTYLSSGPVGTAPLAPSGTTRPSLKAASGTGIGSLKQATGVQSGSNQLGLDSFYQYTTTATGAGSALYTNASSGNTVWNDNLFSNPSRGFATFLRLSYNSLDTTDTTTGFGWSIQASTPTRLGQALDFHPNPHPTTVTLDDGTGTSHLFTWNSTTSTWTSPPGVHLYLQQLDTCGPQTTDARAWSMTRPDGTLFYYDCEGYPTALVDNNGNEADFTYASRQSENKPEEFLTYITDPASRQTLTLNYYTKGQNYSYIDSAGALQTGTNLTNPAIIDHVSSITDISGRTVTFTYTTQGLLARIVDGSGTLVAKTFNFTYDPTQGMKNVKLVAVQDPRGNTTNLTYFPNSSPTKWWTQSVTDRLGHATTFAYTQPGTITGSATQTTVTDANNHASTYQLDATGRLIQVVNALSQKTMVGWDSDNNVASITEDNGATWTWSYDPNTGYPQSAKDAQANKNSTAASTYTYQTSLSGHVAYITDKVSAQGRHWHFTYDANGNLKTVQDPAGTAIGSGYTTTYTYDGFGQLLTATDANNHTVTYSNYDPTGYPDTIKDALGNISSSVYDARGEVTSNTDALGHTTTQSYDVFGRPLDGKSPKDQAGGVYITTPAPIYDTNDNITQATAPNGAVSTAVYNADDEVTSSVDPQDTPTSPTRTTTYTYDPVGNTLTTTSPDGNLPGAITGSYTTTNTYDALDRVASISDALGDKATTTYDNVGNVATTTDPNLNAVPGNTAVSSKIAYDLDHRPTTVTDAAGYTKSTGYDLDGLTSSSTDEDGNVTLYTLDPRGLTTQIRTPHTASGGTITYNTTQITYDQGGNQTSVISPRAVAAGSTTAFTTTTRYNADDEVIAQFGAYDPDNPTYNKAPETDYTYDAVGRMATLTSPPSSNQSVRPVSTYTYWDNGWTKSSTDPFGITTSYDYNLNGQQTSRTFTSAGGSSARTMGWGYYPDGKLASRTDSGVPVGLQVEMVLDSDSQNTAATGTWTTGNTASGYQGYQYQSHAAGSGTDAFTWNLTVPEDGNYTVYVQYPNVTGAATNTSYTINYTGGAATQSVDQTKNSGTWVSLGKYAFTSAGTGQSVVLAQNSGGVVTANAVKIVRDNSADTQPGPNAFTYTYDPSGNLTDLADNSPGARIDDYSATYDTTARISQLSEKKSGTTVHTTGFTYDADGNTKNRTHDQAVDTFTYDARNLLATVVNKQSATDASPKNTTFTWTPGGEVATETKPNGNIVTSSYFLDGQLQHQLETKADKTTTVAEHTYTYDPNGNQTQDASTVQNADNHTATVNDTITSTYTPADQIASSTKSNGQNNEAYTYDLAGNVISQTLGGATTTSTYDRDRLLSTVTGGITSAYNYDPFGRMDTVTTAGKTVAKYTYDGFDHISSEQKYNGSGMVTTNYAYDPFDRTVSQTENAGTSNAKTTVFDYLSMSNAVVNEQVNGTTTKTYQYSPWGERLDQIVHNSNGTDDPTYYTYNAHSDVQAVTDANGDTKSTYGYTAYGADDTSQDTGTDKPGSSTASSGPYNAYRFNADRIDTNTGTYNMGFRNYDPSMNRFLTRDMYNGALADMGLAGDPYTGNRYAFGGGNPLSNIEFDGHGWLSDLGHAALDVAGMVPVVGSVADLANAGWYAYDGDYTDAAISLAGSIPGIGDAALAGRDIVKGLKYAGEADEALQGLKNADHLAGEAAEGVDAAKGADATASAAGHAGTAATDETAIAAAKKEAQQQAAARAAAKAAAEKAAAEKAAAAEAEQTAESQAEKAASCLTGGESFTADTKVLLANGTTTAISNVNPGDEVTATDTTTGKTSTATTSAVMVHHDTDLYDLTIHTTAGDTTIHTTAGHLFYDQTTHTWTEAAALHHGDHLTTADGTTATVATGTIPANTTGDMWDLTIPGPHTFYIVAGDTPVLVHNAGGSTLNDTIGLGDGYTGRLDQFDHGYGTDFEIHVYSRGTEVGIFGSNGFFAKHRLSADVTVPGNVYNRLKGKAIEFMRSTGRIGPLGTQDISGDKWKMPRLGGGC